MFLIKKNNKYTSFKNYHFQHLDIAALLIKYNTVVNATDRWGFTPLHEAAQKGRTQLCALLVKKIFHLKISFINLIIFFSK